MKKWFVLLVLLPLTAGQDLGTLLDPINDAAGQAIPPALDTVYGVTGQNITREDVRLFLDMNITKGDVGLAGLLIGSGKAEVQASIDVRVELRVISSDRIRAAVEGENAYNISAENATWMSDAYIPAEVFRASASAEVVAAFQKDQEVALATYLENWIPELEVISLDMEWKNTHPFGIISDTSLTEPPIVVELHAIVQYIRIESVASLLESYLDKEPEEQKEGESKKEYVARLKGESGDPLRTRDFFSAAAYTQLLNLSMQPGWSLDVTLRVPRGFSFEYANHAVDRQGDRVLMFSVDATGEDTESKEVLLASITHRRGIALAMFGALIISGLIVGGPPGWLYSRFRMEKVAAKAREKEDGT